MRSVLRCSVFLVGVLLLSFATRNFTLPLIGSWLDVSEPPRHADFVMVLSGHNDTRPFAAADLMLNGMADRALITVSQQNSRIRWPQMYVMIKCGIPKEKIEVLKGNCFTTIQEAHALSDFLETHPDATVNVVTNGYHTRRARLAFRAALGDERGRVRFVSAPDNGFSSSSWWRHEDGFVAYTMEYGKLLFYVLRYGRGLWYGAVLVSAALVIAFTRRLCRRTPTMQSAGT